MHNYYNFTTYFFNLYLTFFTLCSVLTLFYRSICTKLNKVFFYVYISLYFLEINIDIS